MRTSWLVLSALLLLAAPGCGDDTTEGADMAVSNVDLAMTMPGTDMNKATCATQIQCGTACIVSPKPGVSLQQCAMSCAAPLTGQPQADFLALVQCVLLAGTTDGGAFDQTAAAKSIAQGGACFSKVVTCNGE